MVDNSVFTRLEVKSWKVHLYWHPIFLVSFGLVILAYFLFQEWRLSGGLGGVPLDDSWIHYRFAENLRSGMGFAFNPGMPTPGSTSPLWVTILAAIGQGFLLPSKVIGVLAYLGCGCMVFFLGKYLGLRSGFALLAGLSTLAVGRLAWAAPSGMETTMFSLVTLIALWAWAHDSDVQIRASTSLIFGVSCLLRPEGILLLGLSGLIQLVRGGLGGANLTRVLKHFVLAGLVIAPYVVFSFLSSGHLLPNTFYAKSTTWNCQFGAGYFLWIGGVFLLDNPVMTLLAGLGMVWSFKSGKWREIPTLSLAGSWCLGLPLLYGFLAPCISAYYMRYSTPLIPVVMIFAAFGCQWLEKTLYLRQEKRKNIDPRSSRRLVYSLGLEGLLLALIPTLLFWAPYYGQSVADIEAMQVRIGRWLAEHSQADDVLAVNDVGAIGSLADREVIDLMGLTTPEVLAFVTGKSPGEWDVALAHFLSQRQPEYMVIFPNWFPELAKDLPATQIYKVQLPSRQLIGIPGITVAGGGEMVVYQLSWAEDEIP